MSVRRRVAVLLAMAALGAAFMWPAFYNGQPIFFGDTSAYIRGADAGVQALLHRRSAWSLSGGNAVEPASAPSAAVAHSAPGAESEDPRPPDALLATHGSSIEDKSVVYGRSPYYGMLLYLGDLTGGFWLSIALQAGAVILALLIALRAVGEPVTPLTIMVSAALAAATSAPFFVSFLEPDIFAGVAVLTCAALLAGGERLRRLDRLAALALLSLCVVVHESIALIVALLLVLSLAGGALGRMRRHAPSHVPRPHGAALAILTAALAVAAVSQLAFAAAVKHVVGAAPLRPPFLMARMIEDGPGYRYLRATCPASGFQVCAYLDRLPVAASLFLWDPGPHGVFSAVPPAARARLSAEQPRFVRAVLLYDPVAELRDAARDVGTQLTMVGLDEFEYPAVLKESFAAKIPPEHFERMRHTAAYRGTMPLAPFSALSAATFALGVLGIAATLALPAARRQLPAPLISMTLWIVAGVLANAVTCAVLSGPHDRYEARVAWVVPAAALLIGAVSLRRLRRSAGTAAAWVGPG